jgi:hypothetical protein
MPRLIPLFSQSPAPALEGTPPKTDFKKSWDEPCARPSGKGETLDLWKGRSKRIRSQGETKQDQVPRRDAPRGKFSKDELFNQTGTRC